MATVTLLGSATFTTASGSKTVTATPAVGDLIVIVTAHSGNTSTATPTDNQSGTYTTIVTSKKATNVDTMMIHIRTALIPAATSTIFTHAPGTSTGGGLAVLKVTGMTRLGADAAKQNAKQENQASGGTPAPVFSATPQSGNPVVGAVFNATSPATMTPRSSPAYTERADVGYSSPTTGLEVMSINSGETSATITWGSTSASAFCDAVVELDTSVIHSGAAALSGVGTLAAIGAMIWAGISAFVGSGALAAVGSYILAGALTLGGSGTLAATGTTGIEVPGAAALSGQGTLTAAGSCLYAGVSSLVGNGTLGAVGSYLHKGAATLSGEGTLAAVGVRLYSAQSALSGNGTLAAVGRYLHNGAAGLSGEGTLATTGACLYSGQSALSGNGTLAAIGSYIHQGVADLSGEGIVVACGVRLFLAQSALSGQGTLATLGHIFREVTDGTGTMETWHRPFYVESDQEFVNLTPALPEGNRISPPPVTIVDPTRRPG